MASMFPDITHVKDVEKLLVPPANLLSFSSVTVHGFASNKGHIYNLSGSFERTESFPAPVHMTYPFFDRFDIPTDIWAPLTPPSAGHLELRLEDKFGEGTIGTSYAATVVSSTTPNIPDRVCVKWAKGRNCRLLAREAWFYEQLYKAGNCEGVITPRYYGLFTMSFRDLSPSSSSPSSSDDSDSETPNAKKITIKPWEELRSNDECLLPDDPIDGSTSDVNFYDEADLKDKSPWAFWTQRKGNDRIISILVLEELGDTYPTPIVDEEALADIREIVTDLGHTGIRHYDLRAPNVMRSLSSVPERDTTSHPGFCHRHQKVHAWRLGDFDRATKTVISDFTEEDQEDCLAQAELVGNSYFMGTLVPWVYPYEY